MNTAARRAAGHHRAGFTLIEILIVVAIIGILAGIAFMGFSRSIRASQVMDGARTLAGDLNLARSAAQRTSQEASVTWSAAANQPIASYTLVRAGAASVRTPSAAVTVTCLAATGGACTAAAADRAIHYRPPFSETAQGAVFRVSSTIDPSIRPLFVKVGGVTGKVIFSGQQN